MVHLSLTRWKRAVIHLEGAATTESHYEHFRFMVEQSARLRAGEITAEEFSAIPSPPTWDQRCTGTAVYVAHAGRRYLLTAQHVIHDAIEAKHILAEAESRITGDEPGWWAEQERAAARARAQESTYSVIFRVRSFDEFLQGVSAHGAVLQNVGSPNPKSFGDCLFSDPRLDLAVISLDNGTIQFRQFVEDLEAHGYAPVTLDDIGDAPTGEGADVFSIGYPASVSMLGQHEPPTGSHWASPSISLPCFTYGRVAMLHPQWPFCWCDMGIYPGNSGGPLIEDDKLVGIVQGQARMQLEKERAGQIEQTSLVARLPYGVAVKGQYAKALVLQQAARDAENPLHHARMRRPKSDSAPSAPLY